MKREECQRLENEVNLAIHLAEIGLVKSIKDWEAVEKAEEAIMRSEDDHFLESDRMIAARGAAMARMRIVMLQALLGKD